MADIGNCIQKLNWCLNFKVYFAILKNDLTWAIQGCILGRIKIQKLENCQHCGLEQNNICACILQALNKQYTIQIQSPYRQNRKIPTKE